MLILIITVDKQNYLCQLVLTNMDPDFSYKLSTTPDSYPVSVYVYKKIQSQYIIWIRSPKYRVGTFGFIMALNEPHQVQLVICDDCCCKIPTQSHEALTVFAQKS